MSKLAPVTQPSQEPQNNTDHKVSNINVGECELTGNYRFIIPDGEYEAIYSHYETASVFTKKSKNGRTGGKVYLYFDIDPLRHQLDQSVKLFKAYNASSVKTTGKNGKFSMTRGKYFVRDYQSLIGNVNRCDQISPRGYKGKMILVKVRTIRNEYSLIDKLIKVIAG